MRSKFQERKMEKTFGVGMGMASWCDRPMRERASSGRLWVKRAMAESAIEVQPAEAPARSWAERKLEFRLRVGCFMLAATIKTASGAAH